MLISALSAVKGISNSAKGQWMGKPFASKKSDMALSGGELEILGLGGVFGINFCAAMAASLRRL